MRGLGMSEILLGGGIAPLSSGPSRRPPLGQALRKAISNFKKGLQEINSDESNRQLLPEADKNRSSMKGGS